MPTLRPIQNHHFTKCNPREVQPMFIVYKPWTWSMRNLPLKATPINSRSLIPFLSQSIYHRILQNAVARKTLSNIVRELNTKHGENEKSLRHCILHAESKILGAGVIVVFKIDYRRLQNAAADDIKSFRENFIDSLLPFQCGRCTHPVPCAGCRSSGCSIRRRAPGDSRTSPDASGHREASPAKRR